MSDDQMWFPSSIDPTVTATPLSIGDGPYASCGCYIGVWHSILPPPRCPMHADSAMSAPWLPSAPITPVVLPPLRLHSDSVEAIARRVAELLRAAPQSPARADHDPGDEGPA